jgi:membrane dipeptidase
MPDSTDERISRLHANGIVDLHFDLPMELYEKRDRKNILTTDFLPDFQAGDIGVIGVAIYIDDRYMPEMALRVGLDQIARLYAEVASSEHFAICKSHEEIRHARKSGKVALVITMEGVEPFGADLDLLRVFYELGARVIGLTHARRNAAGNGGVFAATGSSPQGLTSFGRDVVRECESLGMIVDLAHINPKGFEDILESTTKPVIVSHTNARKYYDIERNISDEQARMVGKRRGVIGVNAVLVSLQQEEATLNRYVDHIEHFIGLVGIDCVGIGFDFFEFLYRQWPDEAKRELAAKFTKPHFIPDLTNHSHARNFTRKMIDRGFVDAEIEKILRGNWMRIFEELL